MVYDGDGNRVSENIGGVTTNYLVDTQNPTGYAQVVEELQNGAVSRTYSYGLERISETQPINSTLTTSFYGYDGQGSVRFLTGSAGAVTDTYDYDGFGNLINQTGGTPNNYLFAGEQYDPNLGVYYNRARYLNTSTGRFLTTDAFEGKLSTPISLHKYLYVSDSPVDNLDPSGNEEISLGATATAISIGLTIDAIGGLTFAYYLDKADYNLKGVEAQEAAKLLVAAALNNLQNGTNPQIFQTYFGPPIAAQVGLVSGNYQNILNALNATISYHRVWFADNGEFAETYRLTTPIDIGLAPAFFRAQLIGGRDTRAGTIVHETSHAVVGTWDYAYGPIAASQLPSAQAVNNADNYEYYAEDSYTIANP
jgi:RHS repeat-associated protein